MIAKEHHHICKLPSGKRKSDHLYYYKGNFYYPLDLVGAQVGLVKRGIREFLASNREIVTRDRSDPSYKTILQLFDEQISGQ